MTDTARPDLSAIPAPRTTFTRRHIIKAVAGAGALIVTPALQNCAHADDTWQPVGKSSDFVKGVPTTVTLKSGGKLLITRVDEKTLTVVSTKCTHKGCEASWSADVKQLLCPCHGAAFQSDGKNLKGTQRRPDEKLPALFSIPVRENNGAVEVNLTKVPADALTPARDA
jgi:Rieske Fe-S protein